jgi:pimeloyl-ACP methyl ester carboxylesterase
MKTIISKYGFRSYIIDVSGISIHYVSTLNDNSNDNDNDNDNDNSNDNGIPNESEKEVFVFIHGTASCSITFFDIMKAMTKFHNHCIAIDLPNFGISGSLDNKWLYNPEITNYELCERYADIIGYTLQSLGIIKRSVLVAHSLGGFFSIYVAHRFPIKKLVLLNPAGILPTLGEYGYYWALFFKLGLPTTLFQKPIVGLHRLLKWIFMRCSVSLSIENSDFWFSFFTNPNNNGHRVLQRLITLKPWYSYWNTPAIHYLMDVYQKVPTTICFGVNDTICPSHIGKFLGELTRGDIMIHNVCYANHNPCENIERMVEILEATRCNHNKTVYQLSRSSRITNCRNGFSYPSLKKTRETIASVYDYLLTHTTCYPRHSA